MPLPVCACTRQILDEVDRSIHDALCVVRSLVKKRFLIVGGGAPEIEVALQLSRWSKELSGMAAYCVRAFAEVRVALSGPELSWMGLLGPDVQYVEECQ